MSQKKMILLVDDDNSFRFAMTTELRALGYVVVSAENGERAIRMVRDNQEPVVKIDLVITDLVMPRKDGMRLCQELKNFDKNIPVLIITGYLSDETEYQLRELGCSDFLEKPFTPQEFVNKVNSLLSE